jgi:glycosyltransferase involved in cell wall biosynthesis
MRRLVMELQRLKPALLYSYLVEPNVVSVLLKLLFPKLRVIWSIQATDMRLHQHDWFVRLTFRLQCRLSRFADLIIATTAAGRAYHTSRGFHRSKFIVIENGVDTDDFRLDPESGQRMRSVWGIPDNLRLIGLVGRLDPIKGHPHFLKAAQLLTDHQDIRFVCVGNGDKEYESSLKKLSADYGIADRVIWAGSRNDMVAVYNALNISCSSSLSEGLPNAIVEAMACGVPCVVTDVGDSALIVGETGVVVPPGDPEALARGMVDCLGKLTASHQRQARERICERFSLGNFMRATEAVFQSLI